MLLDLTYTITPFGKAAPGGAAAQRNPDAWPSSNACCSRQAQPGRRNLLSATRPPSCPGSPLLTAPASAQPPQRLAAASRRTPRPSAVAWTARPVHPHATPACGSFARLSGVSHAGQGGSSRQAVRSAQTRARQGRLSIAGLVKWGRLTGRACNAGRTRIATLSHLKT